MSKFEIEKLAREQLTKAEREELSKEEADPDLVLVRGNEAAPIFKNNAFSSVNAVKQRQQLMQLLKQIKATQDAEKTRKEYH